MRLTAFHQPGRAVHHDQQRIAEAARHQVLQKTEPRVGRFPRPEIEVPPHGLAVFQ
jgi:hypothetical protein